MELLGHPVQPDRLPVALGVRHPEAPRDVLLGGRAALLRDDDDGPDAVELRDPADDRRIVAVAAVAMQLLELFEQAVDDLDRVRPPQLTRELHRLPRRPLGRERRGVGDEAGILRQVAVAFGRLLSEEPIDDVHYRLHRRSRALGRNAFKKYAMRSRSCARGTT